MKASSKERRRDQEELREREPDPPGGREEEGDHVARLEESIGPVVRGETDKLIIFLSNMSISITEIKGPC